MPDTGERVKHYEILHQLGKGGMGEVYLAQDTALDRKVAIKFLPEDMKDDSAAQERFIREAKAAASLDHPFICKIYETGEVDGKAFIVMEYIEGEDLREKMQEGPLPLRDSLRVALEIAEALEKAHENNIIHRDLKPENIMLTPQGHVKVMDFGLAKRILPAGDNLTQTLTKTSITEQGAIIGTLAYMSPEQARGDPLDGRSDIFSFGVILHEMITGEAPFSRPTPVETLTAILRDPPPSVKIKPRKIISPLSGILRKSLAKDPEHRYATVTDLALDIRKVQRVTAVGARLLYRGLPIAIASILVIAMLLIGIWWISQRGQVGVPVTPQEPVSVLVADFQNQTGEPVFDNALEQTLSIGLEDASFISIYGRSGARKLAAKLDSSAGGRLDARLAQLVSRSEGINVVIDGLIEPSGDGYVIEVRALDTVKNEMIAEASKTAKKKADVVTAVIGLAIHVRSELGDISADSAQALSQETFTTSSLEAMKAYTDAQELRSLGRLEEAMEEYRHAISEDPDFGRAYSGLAVIFYSRGQRKEAEKYYQMAMAKVDRMTEREKYRTFGGYYLMVQNHLKAVEEYSALVEKFPADSAGPPMLAYAYFLGRNMSKAVEAARHDAELRPKKIIAQINLGWYALAAGDFELAEKQAQKALELRPSFEKGYVCLALSQLGKDLLDESARTYEKVRSLSSLGASFGATGLADLALYEGRLSDSVTILKKGIAADIGNNRTDHAAYKWTILAHTLHLQGKRAEALEAADSAVSLSRSGDILLSAAQVYLNAGQTDKAREIAGELSKQIQPVNLAYAKLIEGEMSLARDEITEAIKLFREAQAHVDTWLGRFALGRACLKAEVFADAYSEFDKCLQRRGEATTIFLNDLPSYRYFPPVYYYLGRAQEGLGSPAARESYQKFLLIKVKSDGGDPMVEDARKRLGNL